MENSFFEYRDKTGAESDSGSEVIDNSLEVDDSFRTTKTPAKNKTVFVAESEESSADDESEVEDSDSILRFNKGTPNIPKVVIRKSSLVPHVVSSSEDESPDVSPEILPRRRPPPRPTPKSVDSSDTSIIGRRKNKRMILTDSESSFVIEHNKNKKIMCLKDTPLKVEDNKMILRNKNLNLSVMDQSVSYTDDNSDDDDLSKDIESTHEKPKTPSRIVNRNALIDTDLSQSDNDKQETDDEKGESDVEKEQSDSEEESDKDDIGESDNKKEQSEDEIKQSDDNKEQNDEHKDESDEDVEETDDDGPDEDQMAYSRATRMSIMGVIPRGVDESDDSDFILSDEQSRASSANSHSDLPDVTIAKQSELTPVKPQDSDTSTISCSPFSSPLHNITNGNNQIDDSRKRSNKKDDLQSKLVTKNKANKENEDDDVTFISSSFEDRTSLNKRKTNVVEDDVTFVSTNQKATPRQEKSERVIDDDVTIVESKPEIIALSSDDEEEFKPLKKSPSIKKSPHLKDGTMNQYLVPPSYPNQQVVYVKKRVRENELSKLNGLQQDLHNIKYLLANMDLETLPDGGVKMLERLSDLEYKVRQQGEKVANMVVEPDMPTAEDISRDGFDPQSGLSWEELQKGSQAVQPRMFGKQAMATHMAERNHILERLRDLHESLASRPPETKLAPPPPALSSKMMPHQLHALAWLRWRETQRPCGGILADDMGLGKTITMISLVVSDKDGKIDEEDDDDEEGGRGISKLARGGTLVVCPASLMQQWSGEVTKHCVPHAARVCLHHGPARAAHPHRLAQNDIVLTTYNILQRDNEKNGVLMKILWRRIILDEAHIVRNHKSATSAAVSALRGRRRWCLTGTPVQNKDLDLFALLKFLRCTPFDELTMWKKWIDNKSLGGQDRLSTIMQCILLRRTKAQLQERGQLTCLPARQTHLQEVTLSKEEMNVYQKVLVFSKTLFAQFLHQRAEKEHALSAHDNRAYDKMHKRMIALQGAKPVKSHEILVLLLRLRQVCCHCGLIAAMLDEESAGDVDMDPGGMDLLADLNKLTLEDSTDKRKSKEREPEEEGPPSEGTTAAEAIRSVLSPNNPVFQLHNQSSKIRAVMDCLRKNVFANKGHKAVVVSQWTSVLRLVEKELSAARVRCVTLSGNVPVSQRPPLIDKLNDPKSDVTVMLLSLCAGGVGLNLCGANHLLLLDPHWNPQLEEQAQDRIYRVGQTKPVNIYRFMCLETVEQSIRKLQLAKLELAENVLTGAKNTNNSKLTIEDLKMLFNMGQQQQE